MDILRLLFIRLSALGDVVHALPAAAAIKKGLPDTKLSWIAEPPQMELLRDNPLVDEVIEMPKSAWISGLRSPREFLSTQAEIFKFFSNLRARKFDIAIDFQGLMKSALIGYISGAPVRVGYGGTRERSDLLYTHRLEVGDFRAFDRHVVDLHLQLSERLLTIQGVGDVESSAGAEFILPPPKISNRENVDRLFSELSSYHLEAPPVPSETGGGAVKSLAAAGRNGVVVMIPGTTWETKIWPLEKWGELAE
ncbi:MAG TPA: glycosyltransferase family 9 protein, partial [Candidatus Melainabacteria bacterium]|nr:glycosyltransferase family 9 protein [Candidatus Melainabacteria bacterium]